jgi:hypothetical protein
MWSATCQVLSNGAVNTNRRRVFSMWSVPWLYNAVPRITESSVESTITRMEHVLVICEVGRLAIAL